MLFCFCASPVLAGESVSREINALVSDYMQRVENLEQLRLKRIEAEKSRPKTRFDRSLRPDLERPSVKSFGIVETEDTSPYKYDRSANPKEEWRRNDHPEEMSNRWVEQGLQAPTLNSEQEAFVQEFLNRVAAAGYDVKLDPKTLKVRWIRPSGRRPAMSK
jgi:hypothetical protein